MHQASTAGALDDRSLNRRVRRSKKTLVASSDNSGTRRGVPPLTHCEANILASLMQPGVVVVGELVLGRRPAGLVQLRIPYVDTAASVQMVQSPNSYFDLKLSTAGLIGRSALLSACAAVGRVGPWGVVSWPGR